MIQERRRKAVAPAHWRSLALAVNVTGTWNRSWGRARVRTGGAKDVEATSTFTGFMSRRLGRCGLC